MSKTTLSIAMAQMLVRGGRLGENLTRAENMIRRAAGHDCDVVVLPECLDVGWTHPAAPELASVIPGPASDRLCDAARQAGVHVVAGLTERDRDRFFNTAILIDPAGRIRLKHRKINILDIARDLYSVGDRLGVAETSLGTIGVNICADNFRDTLCLGHSLAKMGALTILSPCAWAVPANHDPVAEPYGGLWIDTYTELARSHAMPVIGVSNVGPIDAGPWVGRKCIGCSLAVDRHGKVLLQASYGEQAEELRIVEIEIGEP